MKNVSYETQKPHLRFIHFKIKKLYFQAKFRIRNLSIEFQKILDSTLQKNDQIKSSVAQKFNFFCLK